MGKDAKVGTTTVRLLPEQWRHSAREATSGVERGTLITLADQLDEALVQDASSSGSGRQLLGSYLQAEIEEQLNGLAEEVDRRTTLIRTAVAEAVIPTVEPFRGTERDVAIRNAMERGVVPTGPASWERWRRLWDGNPEDTQAVLEQLTTVVPKVVKELVGTWRLEAAETKYAMYQSTYEGCAADLESAILDAETTTTTNGVADA